MNRAPFAITHQFVDRIPAERKERTLYVSIPFATAAHRQTGKLDTHRKT